jgi:hypothetical protein
MIQGHSGSFCALFPPTPHSRRCPSWNRSLTAMREPYRFMERNESLTGFCVGLSACLWLAFIPVVLGVNFDTCLAEVQSGKWGLTGGTDNIGRPVSNISQATAITYDLCVVACGSGPEPFVWNIFSQQFRWATFFK